MALTLLTGKTGAGKTSKAVELVLDALNSGRLVYTNIEIYIDHPKLIYFDELAIKNFIRYIDLTFGDVSNLELKKKEVNESQYHDCDFFIDEAHLVGFAKKSEPIANWLSIHRHFFQNITAITQSAKRLHSDYLELFHTHIDMIPPNKRLVKGTLGYRVYDSYKGDRLSTRYYVPKADIFELYPSGNSEFGFNQDVLKLLGLLVGLFILLYIAYSSLSSVLNRTAHVANTTQKTAVSTTVSDKKIDSNVSNVVIDSNVSDSNLTDVNNSNIIHPRFSLMCSSSTGCYYNARHYSFNDFINYLVSSKIEFDMQTILKSKKEDILQIQFVEQS